MSPLATLHLAIACLLIGAIAGSEIAAWPSPLAPALDAWGDCTPEAALDDPSTWAPSGKGARLPHTCLAPDTPPDPQIFAAAWGRELTEPEWSVALYRLILAQGGEPFVPVKELPAPAVPIPGAAWLMLGALSAVFLVNTRRLCHCQRDRGRVNTRSH